MKTQLVIMAGGIGSRFWPMSTPRMPKQFIDVLGVGRSMIQLTYDRFCKGENPVCAPENVWVVTSRAYTGIVHEQLPDIPLENILAEPAARNTAPCIAYACWKIAASEPESNLVVSPTDAYVLDTEEYRRVIRKALAQTEHSSKIVTVGIEVVRPETGYGYIELGQDGGDGVHKVAAFKEKPDAATAEAYFRSGAYLWNAGIFVWNLKTISSALRAYAPGICAVMDEISKSFGTPQEEEVIERLFPTCEKISIDYAVMEKSPDIYTIAGDFGWSDLGTWGSLRTRLEKDADGNALVGVSSEDLHNCSGCVVHVDGLEKVAIEGLEDYIVAYRDGRLLICRLSEEQQIREFSK